MNPSLGVENYDLGIKGVYGLAASRSAKGKIPHGPATFPHKTCAAVFLPFPHEFLAGSAMSFEDRIPKVTDQKKGTGHPKKGRA